MAQQNIYDNEIFFEGYKKIRENEINANNLFEIPALFSMMPDLKGKRVLAHDLSLIHESNLRISAVAGIIPVITHHKDAAIGHG